MGRNDSKLPPNRKSGDLNMHRYVYVMACLVGQTVTVHMKDNTQIKGVFHSGSFSSPTSSPNSDISFILKCARELPFEDKLSGEVVDTLIIQGKDIISLTADNCPTHFEENDNQTRRRAGFKTDIEISEEAGGRDAERELEKWEPEASDSTAGMNLGSLEDRNAPCWDQFEVNSRRFQVKSTYQEDFYTTPLDVSSIPQEVKDKADQIAREIEAAQYGTLDPEKIGEGDLDDDEEARFGAVRGTGAYRFSTGTNQRQPNNFPPSSYVQPSSQSVTSTPFKRAQLTAISNHAPALTSLPVTSKEMNSEGKKSNDTKLVLSATSNAQLANSSRTRIQLVPKVGKTGITARAVGFHSGSLQSLQGQMRNASLVKNINALNLEPALPKLDEQGRIDLFSKPTAAGRNGPARSAVPTAIDRTVEKQNFLASLSQIKEKMDRIKWNERITKTGTSMKSTTATSTNSSKKLLERDEKADATSARSVGSSSSKNFKFNPNADAFTPSGRGSSSSFHCLKCEEKNCSDPSKCTHENVEHKESTSDKKPEDKEKQKNRPKFKSLTSSPKYREPIDKFLMSRLLPLLASEVPCVVHPAWNLDLTPDQRRPFSYNQILGDLYANPSAAAAVNAAVGSAYESRQSRPNPESRASSETMGGVERQRTQPGKLGSSNMRPRTGPPSSGQRPASGRPHNGKQGGREEVTSPLLSSQQSGQQPVHQQVQGQAMIIGPGSPQGWRVPIDGSPMYPSQVQIQGHPAAYPTGQPNSSYVVLSRNPMMPQGVQPMVFLGEDGQVQHAVQPSQPMQQSYMHSAIDTNGVPGNADGTNVLQTTFSGGGQLMGVPGSNLVFIPPGAFITAPAPGSDAQNNLNPQQAGAQQPQQGRWVQTGVDASGAPIVQQERVASSPNRISHDPQGRPTTLTDGNQPDPTAMALQPGMHQMLPNQYNYHVFHPHPQQFSGPGPHPQFIGFPPMAFPTSQGPGGTVNLPQQYGYITPTQFQPPIAPGQPGQPMNYQTSQMGGSIIMSADSQTVQDVQQASRQGHRQGTRESGSNSQSGGYQNGPPLHSPGIQRQMSMKHQNKNYTTNHSHTTPHTNNN